MPVRDNVPVFVVYLQKIAKYEYEKTCLIVMCEPDGRASFVFG